MKNKRGVFPLLLLVVIAILAYLVFAQRSEVKALKQNYDELSQGYEDLKTELRETKGVIDTTENTVKSSGSTILSIMVVIGGIGLLGFLTKTIIKIFKSN